MLRLRTLRYACAPPPLLSLIRHDGYWASDNQRTGIAYANHNDRRTELPKFDNFLCVFGRMRRGASTLTWLGFPCLVYTLTLDDRRRQTLCLTDAGTSTITYQTWSMVIIGNRPGKDIINRLLEKNESRRLGSQSGASQVKRHKWFAKVNWALLRSTTPPVSQLFVSALFPPIPHFRQSAAPFGLCPISTFLCSYTRVGICADDESALFSLLPVWLVTLPCVAPELPTLALHLARLPLTLGIGGRREPCASDCVCVVRSCDWAARGQIVPATSNGLDAVNFRSIRESQSLQFEVQGVAGAGVAGQPGTPGLKGTEDGLEPVPDGEPDAFEGFSSMTLKYDGEEP